MAKTLIGNVRGKDGRGISSIKKTATDGTIDTYTITYTDGTTSTFNVTNSDEIALQRQIVSASNIETGNKATRTYSKGDYIFAGGVLKKATTAIASGSTFSSANSQDTTITNELKNGAGAGAGGSGSGESYSLSETATGGTWIDGSKIYKKTLKFENQDLNNTVTLKHGISNLNTVIKVDCIYFDGVNSSVFPINTTTGNDVVGLRVRASDIAITGNDSYSAKPGRYLLVTIYYTKLGGN